MKILIVDDVNYQVKLLQSRLSKVGYEILTNTSPVDALKWLNKKDRQIDIILCDLMMPEMDGLTFKQVFDNSNQNKLKPIFILMSASNNTNDLKKAYDKGYMSIFQKPFNFNHLVQTLQKLENI